LEYAFTVLYNPALMATKTSILILYLRLAKVTQVILRIASYVTLAIVIVAGVVLTFLNAFQCSPVISAFSPDIHGKCVSIVTLYLCSAPVNIITDLAILVLPIPVLTGMQLPLKQKAILVFTFALGIFATIIDVVRIYYLQRALDTQRSMQVQEQIGNSSDFSWIASMPLMWSAVEVNAGIICACIPTLRPLFQRILPSIITDRLQTKFIVSDNFDSRQGPDLSPTCRGGSAMDHDGMENPLNSQAETGSRQEDEEGMMEFLTTPDMNQAGSEGRITRPDALQRQTTNDSVYFGFVDIKEPRNMLTLTGKESFKYCAVVTLLFFLWGFSYGLLISLVDHVTGMVHNTLKRDIGLTSAYFSAYFCGPLTIGQWVLRRGGFKATFICGLCIYGIGTLMFWPSAVLVSYPGFIVCQFVVGFGLSTLETAANPFLALCGPPQYAEFRLLLAQGVQSSANLLSQVLAQRALFSKITAISLIDVQWTYLAIALFTVILGLVIYYMPLPEAADTELQNSSERLPISSSQTFLSTKLPLIWITLISAIFAQFCYTGAQESIYVWQGSLLYISPHASSPKISINSYGLLTQATFTIGRFLFALLCLAIPPRFLLLLAFTLGTLFATLIMSLNLTRNGIAGISLVFFFFEGPIFPLIFAIGLRGRGKWTKYVAAGITASSCGCVIFPYVMWVIIYDDHRGVQYAFCVIVALFASGTIFPAYLTLFPNAGRQIDPVPIGERNISLTRSSADQGEPEKLIRRLNRTFGIILSKFCGVYQGRRSSELPIVGSMESAER
jgi:fucose permease